MAGKHIAEITKAKSRTKKKNKNGGGAGNHQENGKVTKPTKRIQKDDSRNKKKIVNVIVDKQERDDDVVIIPDSASESQSEKQNLQGYENREVASDTEDDDVHQGNGEEDEEVESLKIQNLISTKEGNDTKKKKKINETAAMYSFPMHRVSRMIKADDPDIRITQEAVFLINKASEKFLKLFTKEGYAFSSLEKKKHVEYKHLSSVVCKKRRFDFLSDFVPEKVKAENALTETPTDNP
ncbi:uncharacterized protein LOC124920725 [Impatiens glandulifera]|uniref:uncharacterized protein LOC124920725 n=1 Tax=Impatiens glandulifera TaxID=253017 RepID=UPI001FB094C4|nr:uncharacterized protein LOC124920725 [Impatiens glandulifera]